MPKIDPDAIWKFENSSYTQKGIAQINDEHLLDLHNKVSKYLGEEERTSLPSRKMLESRTISLLVRANAPGVKTAPDSVKPTKKRVAKSDIPSDSDEQKEETDMKTAAKTKAAAKPAKTSDRRKAAPSKERKARVSFEGQKLNAKVKENPRREGSGRHTSLELVIKNPGITYENYIKKGGEHGDLLANVNKGLITAK